MKLEVSSQKETENKEKMKCNIGTLLVVVVLHGSLFGALI